ncbi:hypothetical protein FQZ97_439310 [compost metagenome]
MGSKIPQAFVPGRGKFTAWEYEALLSTPQPYCHSTGCQAEISFVKRHDRQFADQTIEVAPSYRLKKSAVHHPECIYNLNGRLQVVARSSDSDVFEAFSQAQYEFRLHVLLKEYWETTKQEYDQKAKAPGPTTQEKDFANRGRLSSYLKTLKQILELRNLCNGNEELKEVITLNFKGKKIPWSKFFFDHRNLHYFLRCYPADSYTIPLAINGHIRQIEPPTGNLKYHTVKLSSPYVAADVNNVIKKPMPQIVVTDPSVAEELVSGDEYIFFGVWKPSLSRNIRRNIIWENQKIEMRIQNDEHFIRCLDMTQGE